jgi:hypothetical protein
MVIKDSGLNTSNLGNAEETNRAVTSITKILTKAVEEAVRREEIPPKQVPWLSLNLDLMARGLKRAKRRLRKDPSETNKTIANNFKSGNIPSIML